MDCPESHSNVEWFCGVIVLPFCINDSLQQGKLVAKDGFLRDAVSCNNLYMT